MAESRFTKLLNKVTDNRIQPGDENVEANSVRNALANSVNPLLDEYVNPVLPESVQLAIPKQTVADEKNYYANLPEQMAGATMGSIKTIPSARFGKIIQVAEEAPQALGKVVAKPSMADLVSDASKINSKPLKASGIKEQFDDLFGAEALKRKSDMKQGLTTPEAYGSWKQEMMNKLRGE